MYTVYIPEKEKEEKKQFRTAVITTPPQTNFGGEVGESPGRRKAGTKESIQLNSPEEMQGGRRQRWNETPDPKRTFRRMGMQKGPPLPRA